MSDHLTWGVVLYVLSLVLLAIGYACDEIERDR